MQKLQVFAYKSGRELSLGFVRHPGHVAGLDLGEGQAVLLTQPLPSSQAYEQMDQWHRRLRGRWGWLRWNLASGRPVAVSRSAKQPTPDQIQDVLAQIREALRGRIIAEHRLAQRLKQEGFWPSQISLALDVAVFRGEVRQLPGFQSAPWGAKRCSRCGGTQVRPLPCRHCGGLNCLLCLECASLGEHRACTTLLALAGPRSSERGQAVELTEDIQLTPAQRQAAQELLDFWGRREGRALVWAACGAGKTEVTFALIQRALEEGHEVLFAIPRQDVVRELAERLQRAFPGVAVAVHHGGRPWQAEGRLVVATTHQVLQFYQRFELAILDEVDAFPFHGSEMLRFGLKRSLTERGQLVEMTATPSRARPSRVITIPARHHGFPLPEPEIIVEKLGPCSQLQADQLPQIVVERLSEADHPWLVFAPTIAACTALHQALAVALPKRVGRCHSKLEERRGVIEKFRRGELDVLVSTSVLERGVTFPRVGVMVLYADHPVFSSSSLVQMAGRVGRTSEAPTGPVLFVGSKLAPAMKEAAELIRELNDQARERGLLIHENPK